jgi:transcriptional regulator with XRE-family HTH domain
MGTKARSELARRIGAVIKSQRLRAGMSQERLAIDSSIDRSYLSDIERGLSCPTLETLDAIAATLNIKVSDLIRQTEE